MKGKGEGASAADARGISESDEDHLARVSEAMKRLGLVTIAHCCGWCHRRFGEDEPVVSLYAKPRGESDLSEHEGGMIILPIGGRQVLGLVPEAGSPVDVEADVVFMLCSRACACRLMPVDRR